MNERVSAIDRVVFVGPTRSGKSSLAVRLVKRIAPGWPVLIINPKPAAAWFFAPALKDPAEVLTMSGPRQVHLGTTARGAYDPYLLAAWQRGGITVVLDDFRLLTMHGATQIIEMLLIAGGERFLGTWSIMQRPVRMLEALSEAEWAFVFSLALDTDRERMMERGIPPDMLAALKEHEFLSHRLGAKPIAHPALKMMGRQKKDESKRVRKPVGAPGQAGRGAV